jgi:hypothetical protein
MSAAIFRFARVAALGRILPEHTVLQFAVVRNRKTHIAAK